MYIYMYVYTYIYIYIHILGRLLRSPTVSSGSALLAKLWTEHGFVTIGEKTHLLGEGKHA